MTICSSDAGGFSSAEEMISKVSTSKEKVSLRQGQFDRRFAMQFTTVCFHRVGVRVDFTKEDRAS
jgi:hypothetical protein